MSAFRRHGGDEADVALIEHVVAAIERFRAALRRVQQIAQRRHRAVVKVRAAQPDPVQRMGGVAVGLAEVREPVGRLGIERRTGWTRRLGVYESSRYGSVPIVADWFDQADTARAAITPSLNRGSAWQFAQCCW